MFLNSYRGKRVLVTGHTGFKGTWLSEWLLKLKAEVAGFSLYIPSDPSHFEVLGLEKKMRHYVGDIRNPAELNKVFEEFRPQYVFHLAAQAIVKTAIDAPRETFETNLMGTVNVLEAIKKYDKDLQAAVLITSDKCYENVEWEYGYRENDRLGGKDPYSASKACAELAISTYFRTYSTQSKPLPVIATRAGNVIGGGDWARDRIVPDCMKAWAKNDPVVMRNPHSTRPWQHVLEPLSGYLWAGAKLAENNASLAGEAFNFGPAASVNRSVLQLVEEMTKIWKTSRFEIDAPPSAKHEAGLLKLCCDKALHRLNWNPTLSFDETVLLTAEWYHKFYKNGGNMTEVTRQQIEQYETWARERGHVWAKS